MPSPPPRSGATRRDGTAASRRASRSLATLASCGVAVLGACASDAPSRQPAVAPPPDLRVRVYDCEGQEAMVRLRKNGGITLTLPSRSVRLPQVRSASGEKYASGETSFWIKGPIGRLDLPGTKPARCEENRPRSLREDARLRGVHYRGLGNEPGWRIEIGPEEIALDYDYGEARLVAPLVEPVIPVEGRRIYTTATETQRLQISIEETTCLDPMTSEAFETRVQVTLDGRTLRGCGDLLR